MEDCINISFEDFAEFHNRKPPEKRILKQVVEYSLDGEVLNVYDTIKSAQNGSCIGKDLIAQMCHGKRLCSPAYKRIFLFRGDDIEERLIQIEEARKEGKYIYAERYKPFVISEYSLGGRLLAKYETSKAAAICNHVTANLIQSCCKGKRLFINNRIFLYTDDDSIKDRVKKVKSELYRLSQKRPRYKPVDVYTLDGKFIQGFPSASAASKELGVHVSNITRCCMGSCGILTASGKIFLWLGDSISERLQIIKERKNDK